MTVETEQHCDFMHVDFSATGLWYGQCTKGRASGMGYGVVRDAGGGSMEYIGNTSRGLASGTGAMIIRLVGKSGASYFAGEFLHGQPDGVLIVEETGKPSGLRKFKNGEDKGKGDSSLLKTLSFASGWSKPDSLIP